MAKVSDSQKNTNSVPRYHTTGAKYSANDVPDDRRRANKMVDPNTTEPATTRNGVVTKSIHLQVIA